MFEANTAAMRGYRIEPCAEPARILFCRALARDAHTPAHPERPWQARLGTRLEVVEVAGDHLSMLRPPHVAAVAALLEHWLEAFPAPTGLRPARGLPPRLPAFGLLEACLLPTGLRPA
ncbi:MAG: hypothetical protein U1E17_06220 [Geminicoccaceae bacterium]